MSAETTELDETDITLDEFAAAAAAASAVDAYLGDTWMQRITTSGSIPLDIGRATRTVPLDLFPAVAHRDGGCRYPGCTKRIAWTEAHHITVWRHGGPTSLDNLVLLCTRHRHLIHRPGWHLKLLPNGNVYTTTPAGRTHTSQPRPPTHRLQTLSSRKAGGTSGSRLDRVGADRFRP